MRLVLLRMDRLKLCFIISSSTLVSTNSHSGQECIQQQHIPPSYLGDFKGMMSRVHAKAGNAFWGKRARQ